MKKTLLALSFLFSFQTINAQTTKVVIETDSGKIVMALYDNTPLHRDNMIKLVKEKFFDSTLFHRCIPNFVIQGGDPDSKHAQSGAMLGNGELPYKINAEINDSNFHQRGAVGMARDNNPEKASSACQFYIVTGRKYTDQELDRFAQRNGRTITARQREIYKNEGGTAMLDGNYTVYGIVTEGMDVVEKISMMPRDQMDRPITDIRMNKVYIWEAPKPTTQKSKGKNKK